MEPSISCARCTMTLEFDGPRLVSPVVSVTGLAYVDRCYAFISHSDTGRPYNPSHVVNSDSMREYDSENHTHHRTNIENCSHCQDWHRHSSFTGDELNLMKLTLAPYLFKYFTAYSAASITERKPMNTGTSKSELIEQAFDSEAVSIVGSIELPNGNDFFEPVAGEGIVVPDEPVKVDGFTVVHLEQEIARLKAELAVATSQHHHDINIISEALLEAAEEYEWCEEFDKRQAATNADLHVKMNERGTNEEATVSGWLHVPFTVVIHELRTKGYDPEGKYAARVKEATKVLRSAVREHGFSQSEGVSAWDINANGAEIDWERSSIDY